MAQTKILRYARKCQNVGFRKITQKNAAAGTFFGSVWNAMAQLKNMEGKSNQIPNKTADAKT
jgi:acylphosphatase